MEDQHLGGDERSKSKTDDSGEPSIGNPYEQHAIADYFGKDEEVPANIHAKEESNDEESPKKEVVNREADAGH